MGIVNARNEWVRELPVAKQLARQRRGRLCWKFFGFVLTREVYWDALFEEVDDVRGWNEGLQERLRACQEGRAAFADRMADLKAMLKI